MSQRPTDRALHEVVEEAHGLVWAARHLATADAHDYLRALIAHPHLDHHQLVEHARLDPIAAGMTRIALESLDIVHDRIYLTHRTSPT